MPNVRKQIAFDLDTKLLKSIYCEKTGKHYTRAYYDLGAYLKKRGFLWRQGSVYESQGGMSFYEVAIVTTGAVKNLPWLSECTRDIVATNIGARHSLMPEITAPSKKKQGKKKKPVPKKKKK
ncbi:MAG: hypothetical protein IK016_11230 [Lachnospiraceae bacterium]|nr:hypothetical protein [Lachnospiraceae bacterium]